MSDFDDLDSLLGPLREPATPAELASERAMIDLMVTSHRNPKGTPMFSSRRARVATLIAAGVIGFGGVAAAGGGFDRTSPDDTPNVDPAPQVIEIEEIEEEGEVEEVTTTTAAAAVEESDDDTFTDEIAKATLAAVAADIEDSDDNPATDFNEDDCLDGNHGLTVSEVARGENPLFADVEVRDAAHSDCGKTDDDATKVDDDDDAEIDDESSDDDDDDADHEDDEDDDDDDDDDDDARGSKGGNGNGNHGKSDKDD